MHALICCDEQDGTVGHFVQMCADQAHELIDDLGIIINRINSDELSAENVSIFANQNGDEPFICAAFSHGNESALINTTLGEDYVSLNVNLQSFKNVFFYTWSCSSGQNLGPALTVNGCSVYIGHVEPVEIPPPGDDMYILELFVECALHGLRLFYDQGLTAVDSLNKMRDFYDEKVEELLGLDPLAATKLQDHSNSLTIFGNKNLTYQDLFPKI